MSWESLKNDFKLTRFTCVINLKPFRVNRNCSQISRDIINILLTSSSWSRIYKLRILVFSSSIYAPRNRRGNTRSVTYSKASNSFSKRSLWFWAHQKRPYIYKPFHVIYSPYTDALVRHWNIQKWQKSFPFHLNDFLRHDYLEHFQWRSDQSHTHGRSSTTEIIPVGSSSLG